jgi:hypothetical protein
MLSSLTALHGVAFGAHLVQCGVIGALVAKDPGQKWPLVSQGYQKPQKEWEYHLGYLLPVFPGLSSINHAVALFLRKGSYDNILRDGVNPVRWAEFSVSAGVMLWVICTLSGIVEIRTLVSIAMLNAALQYVGYLIEKAKANNQDTNELLLVGFSIHTAIWSQIFISFYTSVAGTGAPKAVYSIVLIMFSLFTSFGVLSALWAKGAIKSFQAVESGYILLSLIAKSFLTWMVYFGVLKAGGDRVNAGVVV